MVQEISTLSCNDDVNIEVTVVGKCIDQSQKIIA